MNNKYKILLVEDETNIRNLVSTMLESAGYQVRPAGTCATAKMLYGSHRPDLIILDLGLPDRDGRSLLELVRRESATPVIVLSARSDEQDKVEALDMGANDYITKPFGSAELLARVRSALRSTHQARGGAYSPEGRFRTADLVIDYDSRRVFRSDKAPSIQRTADVNVTAVLHHDLSVRTVGRTGAVGTAVSGKHLRVDTEGSAAVDGNSSPGDIGCAQGGRRSEFVRTFGNFDRSSVNS